MPHSRQEESAQEWGRRQAAAAPPWSDAKWRRMCAVLGVGLAPPSQPQRVALAHELDGDGRIEGPATTSSNDEQDRKQKFDRDSVHQSRT